MEQIKSKIQSVDQLAKTLTNLKGKGKKIVFTNGCFDLLHSGHIAYLNEAAQQGDILVIGVNSDASISRLKGPKRPIKDLDSRLLMLAAFGFVDYVTSFDTDTPYDLIKSLMPDMLVKGGDWTPDQIVGSDIVLAAGGEVRSLQFVEGYSTSNIEQIIIDRNCSSSDQ